MEFILLLLAPMKPKPKTQELMRERTMSHVKQLGILVMKRPWESDGTREPLGRSSTEAAEVRHAQTSSKPVSYTQAAEATTNNENDNEPRRTALIMMPTRESDGAPTPRTKLNGSSRSAICKQKQQARLVHTHRSRASSKSTAGGAKHRSQNAGGGAEHMKRA